MVARLLEKCRFALRTERQILSILWIQGYEGLLGNEVANELAQSDSNLNVNLAYILVDFPLWQLESNLEEVAVGIANASWTATDDCVISRQLWSKKNLISTFTTFRTLIGVITDHCILGDTAIRYGLRMPRTTSSQHGRDIF